MLSRFIVEIDDKLHKAFAKAVASHGFTKKYVIVNLMRQWLIDQESYPQGFPKPLTRSLPNGTPARADSRNSKAQ